MTDKWVGQTLPKITLDSSEGNKVSLPKSGKWTLLYFYPKDDTPGCTRQACSYRDNLQKFTQAGVELYGVSSDDLKSHDAFIHKFSLNFPLLSDVKNELSGALGVFGEQEWKGQRYKGLSRDTFLVDPQGKIREVWRKVNPDQTMDETFTAIKKYVA